MFIVNPYTFEKNHIFSKEGLKLLKKYIKHFQKGGTSPENPISINVDEIIARDFKSIIDEEGIILKDKINALESGTFAYYPPEIFKINTNADFRKSDIWSLGVVFIELFTLFQFYIILNKINKNKTEIFNNQYITDAIKEDTISPNDKYAIPQFTNEDTLNESHKYLDYIKNDYRTYLSPENQTKIDSIFELIKNMIKFKMEDRINARELVNELQTITNINTNNVTIPFYSNNYDQKVEASKIHSNNPENLKKFSREINRENPLQKIGIFNINTNEVFYIGNVKQHNCENYCVVSKKEGVEGSGTVNINEVLIHKYLSYKDELHKYIVDFYTYKMYKTHSIFTYMEYVDKSLKEYMKHNYKYIDFDKKLQKYYFKSFRRLDQVNPEVGQIYDKYLQGSGVVELGGEKCSVSRPCKFERGIREIGNKITCKLYGMKKKCKTNNIELATEVVKKAINEQFEEKCIIMLKLAEALQFIHANNIVHSDIKPHNIVIKKNKHNDITKYLVKFIDFGTSFINIDNNLRVFKQSTSNLKFKNPNKYDVDRLEELVEEIIGPTQNVKPGFYDTTNTKLGIEGYLDSDDDYSNSLSDTISESVEIDPEDYA